MQTSANYDDLIDWLLNAVNADAERYPNAPRSTDDEDWSVGGLPAISTYEFEEELAQEEPLAKLALR